MRRLLVAVSALGLLALPTSAPALRGNLGDGTLVVKNGNGSVAIVGRGGAIGRCSCKLVIDDPVGGDGTGPIVYGADRIRELSATKTEWVGDLRFRIIGGFFRMRIVGRLISVSFVGSGVAVIAGSGFPEDGTVSVNGEDSQSLPDSATRYQIGLPPAASSSGAATAQLGP